MCTLLAALAMASCDRNHEPYYRTIYTFGTFAGISIYNLPRDEARAAADRLEQRLALMNRDWYAWGDGELGELNRDLKNGTRIAVSNDLGDLLRKSLRLRERSGGRFDPAIGSLVELWGFHSDEDEHATSPERESIEQNLAATDVQLETDAGKVYVVTNRPGVVIDLGGIAKGAALAESLEILRQMGVSRAIVDLGGDVVVVDDRETDAFRVGIRDPRKDGVIGVIEPRNGEAVVTSGDYERYFESDGERFHHIIDPVTGYPSVGALSVTVVSTDAILADAAATALMVAGPALLESEANRMGVDMVALIDTDGELHLTTAMQERIDLESTAAMTSAGD